MFFRGSAALWLAWACAGAARAESGRLGHGRRRLDGLNAWETALVEELGASSMADMGRVMGAASTKFAGRADGKAISAIVRSLLA